MEESPFLQINDISVTTNRTHRKAKQVRECYFQNFRLLLEITKSSRRSTRAPLHQRSLQDRARGIRSRRRRSRPQAWPLLQFRRRCAGGEGSRLWGCLFLLDPRHLPAPADIRTFPHCLLCLRLCPAPSLTAPRVRYCGERWARGLLRPHPTLRGN